MNGPADWIATGGMIAATVAGLIGCGAAVLRVRGGGRWDTFVERGAIVAVTLLCAAVFVERAIRVHAGWAPLNSHVDGLSLLTALLGAALLWLQWRRNLAGLGLFTLPVVTLLALWGVCASWWSMKPFHVRGVWDTVHLLSVYVGTLGVTLAAAAGGLWLLVDRQLRGRDHAGQRLRMLGRLADLESIERVITLAATGGFVLLTIALATGLVILSGAGRLAPGWWYGPKVGLTAAVWAIFALLMHVRYVPNFRGRRAAVLSIVGFALLVAVLGIAQALPGSTGQHKPADEPAANGTPASTAESAGEPSAASLRRRSAATPWHERGAA